MKNKVIDDILASDGFHESTELYLQNLLLQLPEDEWMELENIWKGKPVVWQQNLAEVLEPMNPFAINILESMVINYYPDITWKAAETLLLSIDDYQPSILVKQQLNLYIKDARCNNKDIYEALLKK